jgi:hypothetical protein
MDIENQINEKLSWQYLNENIITMEVALKLQDTTFVLETI